MPVAAPSDKRFRRSHVSPSKRTARPRSWSWRRVAGAALVVAALSGVVRLVNLAFHADALTITRLTVRGNSRMSSGEVLALVGGVRGSNMLRVRLETWRQKLRGSPWVADAALRRVFPDTISVAIVEREPMAVARLGGGLYLIDQRAVVIDEYGPHYAEFDLPIVEGLAGPPSGGTLVDAGRAALAGGLLSDLRRHQHLASLVSEIDVTDVKDAAVILKGDTTLVRVGAERFAERIQSYLDLAPALRERVPSIDYVDLRFGERVYVKPQGPDRRRPTTGGGE